MSSRIMFIVGLTMSAHFGCFADREHVSPKISCVNVPGLNILLRSKIFVSEDRQLRATHLILGYEPLSRIYQDAGQALRASNPRLARIDVSKPGFLARQDLPPVVLLVQLNPLQFVVPLQQVPLVVVPVAEGVTSSSHLSLEEEIDRFQFTEERTPERLVKILDSETEFDRLSTAHQPGQIVAFVETSSKEAKAMDLKKRPSLRGLMANRVKGATPPEAPKAQTFANLPLTDQGPRANPDPK